jgi:hypothetical protein
MTVAVPAQVAGLFVFPRVSGISVALLLLPITAALRRRKCGRKIFRLLGIGVAVLGGLAGMATFSGCGNGNGFPVQASRSYSLSVTATSGTLTHAMSVALTVE